MDITKRLCMLLLLCGVAGIVALIIIFTKVVTKNWPATSGTPSGYVTITSLNIKEITVNPGENFSLICEGDTALSWKYPDTADRSPKIELISQNGKFVSSLQLLNVTYRDVGYYNCSSDNNQDKYSAVYVFVKDEENLITYNDAFFIPIHGIQYQNITLPCKPTHPDVKLDLCYQADLKGALAISVLRILRLTPSPGPSRPGVVRSARRQELVIGENKGIGVIRYDNKVGFTLENAERKNCGYYCCVLSSNSCSGDECSPIFSLDVLKYTDSVTKPLIEEMDPPRATVGNNVTLICKVTVAESIKFSLQWIVPNKTDPRFIINESTNYLKRNGHIYTMGLNELTVQNVKLEDEGNYICQVTDHSGNRNSEEKYLRVYN